MSEGAQGHAWGLVKSVVTWRQLLSPGSCHLGTRDQCLQTPWPGTRSQKSRSFCAIPDPCVLVTPSAGLLKHSVRNHTSRGRSEQVGAQKHAEGWSGRRHHLACPSACQ